MLQVPRSAVFGGDLPGSVLRAYRRGPPPPGRTLPPGRTPPGRPPRGMPPPGMLGIPEAPGRTAGGMPPGNDEGRIKGSTPGDEGRTAGGGKLGALGRMTPELGGRSVTPGGLPGVVLSRSAGGGEGLGRGTVGAGGRLLSPGVMMPGEGEAGGFRAGRDGGGGLRAEWVREELGRTDGGEALPLGPGDTFGPLEPPGGTMARLEGGGGEPVPTPGTCPTRPVAGLLVEGLGRTLGGGLDTTAPGILLTAGGRY